MTPGAKRVLDELAADEDIDLVQEGRYIYCGNRQTTASVVNELLSMLAISITSHDGFQTKTTYYGISDIGRSILRRPELEHELYASLPTGRAITIINDRIESADVLSVPRPSTDEPSQQE